MIYKRFNFANEDKSTTCSNFFLELIKISKHCELIRQNRRFEFNHCFHREFIIWQSNNRSTCIFINNFHFLLYDIIIFFFCLFLKTNFIQFLNILNGTTVKDRHFRCVKFNKTVIYASGIKGS